MEIKIEKEEVCRGKNNNWSCRFCDGDDFGEYCTLFEIVLPRYSPEADNFICPLIETETVVVSLT